MPMRAPLVEAEQHGSIRIHDLTEVVMLRSRLGLAEEDLVPIEAAGNVPYADDRPCAFHRIPPATRYSIRVYVSCKSGSQPLPRFNSPWPTMRFPPRRCMRSWCDRGPCPG